LEYVFRLIKKGFNERRINDFFACSLNLKAESMRDQFKIPFNVSKSSITAVGPFVKILVIKAK
jgi:hypothetical protein